MICPSLGDCHQQSVDETIEQELRNESLEAVVPGQSILTKRKNSARYSVPLSGMHV